MSCLRHFYELGKERLNNVEYCFEIVSTMMRDCYRQREFEIAWYSASHHESALFKPYFAVM